MGGLEGGGGRGADLTRREVDQTAAGVVGEETGVEDEGFRRLVVAGVQQLDDDLFPLRRQDDRGRVGRDGRGEAELP
ncbi:MAG TPA: hypothetical protein VER37_06180, partial [Thermomicrobiales bacterium]|nr:hypothetical protein [Thermomicrobiales bacterium]